MPDANQQIAHNLEEVRARIAEACRRSGREPGQVTLVAVTKYVSAQVTRQLVQAGCGDLGESRPQELWRKADALQDLNVRWHLVGHLQRNKARRTLPLVCLLHAGDSDRLLLELDALAGETGRRVPVLIEVNISGDPQKHGFTPLGLERSWEALVQLQHLELRGLMAMAARQHAGAAAQPDFAALRLLRDRLQSHAPPDVRLEELSMGMSGDFEYAIREGATIVRVGSALFEGLSDA